MRVGAKAAWLSRALQRGLPVLPGFVIPVDVSRDAINGALLKGLDAGVHAARLGVMEGDSREPFAGIVRQASKLGATLVVRSSSPLEADGRYAGQFSSYAGVREDEVITAMRGVWASGVTDEGIERWRASGGRDRSDGMGVLVQPEVLPEYSGSARTGPDSVTIVWVVGGSAGLMSGQTRGATAHVRVADATIVETKPSRIGRDALLSVAKLAQLVTQECGGDLIEWAIAPELGVLLLQSGTGAASGTRQRSRPAQASDALQTTAAARSIARLLRAFAGPVGETVLLPVLLAGVTSESRVPSVAVGRDITSAAAAAAWRRARALALELQLNSTVASHEHHSTRSPLQLLRDLTLTEATEQLAAMPAAEGLGVETLVTSLGSVVEWMLICGAIRSVDDFWGLTEDTVSLLVSTASPGERFRDQGRAARRLALLHWEPLIVSAIMASGIHTSGEGVSGGCAAGVGVVIDGIPRHSTLLPRAVIVAPHPIPQLSPLLYGAAALVTYGGSSAAHLVEVARSLGVPAVLGCDQDDFEASIRLGDTLIAVDGDIGVVSVDAANPSRF